MKMFNITAQVYENTDANKQTILFNQVFDGLSAEEALFNFKLNFPSIEYSLIKVYSVEEIF